MTMSDGAPLLSVRDLRIHFHTDNGIVRAVDGVSFDVGAGEVFGIVGESGSGKSITAMSILGLIPMPPGKVESGQILWHGNDLLTYTDAQMRRVRGGEIAMIFQDPLTAMNPVYTVGTQIAEMVLAHQDVSKRQAHARAVEMLALVGIPRAAQRADDFPHQFSGGMRQRAMIAMALACEPKMLICDEPTTALDVTIQAQVLEVIQNSAKEFGAAIVLITHDLGVVAGMVDRVAVMYGGKIVEQADVDDVYERPRMPYTWGLLNSIPRLDDRSGHRLDPIPGVPPNPRRFPSGCRFHPRCMFATSACVSTEPELIPVSDAGTSHVARCIRVGEPGWEANAPRHGAVTA